MLGAGEYMAVAFASRVRPLERDERTIELRVIKEDPR
jgi:hypothetical protein